MVTFLSRIFIRDCERTGDPRVRTAYGMLCGALGIALNVLLFLGKYLAGILSGSVAVSADAFNNLSDAASSAVTLIGFRFASRKADAGHPFGHGRIEYVAGLGVSAAILLMGLGLLRSSVEKIRNPQPVRADLAAVVILLASICVKLYMCWYNRAVGKKIGSETMKAVALDSLSDCAATAAVLFTLLFDSFAGKNIDGWCGLLVACLVLWAGRCAARDTLSPLLGEPPPKEFVDEVRAAVLAHPEILGVHDLVVHDYGPGRRMISLHVEVDGKGSVAEIHAVVDRIEQELRSGLDCEAVIHTDPVEPDDPVECTMRREVAEKIGERFSGVTIHDFRMTEEPDRPKMVFEVQIPYDYPETNEEVKRGIEALIAENWRDIPAEVRVEQSYI